MAPRLQAALATAVLVLAYFGVLTPAALLRRLLGGDLLGLRREPRRASYWVERDPARRSSLRDQF